MSLFQGPVREVCEDVLLLSPNFQNGVMWEVRSENVLLGPQHHGNFYISSFYMYTNKLFSAIS